MEHPKSLQNNLLNSKERAEHKRQQLQTINKFGLQTSVQSPLGAATNLQD